MVVPVLQLVRRKVVAADDPVLREDDRAERAGPVPDEPEEVAQRIVEFVRTDDRERDDTAPGARQLDADHMMMLETHIAVASSENM